MGKARVVDLAADVSDSQAELDRPVHDQTRVDESGSVQRPGSVRGNEDLRVEHELLAVRIEHKERGQRAAVQKGNGVEERIVELDGIARVHDQVAREEGKEVIRRLSKAHADVVSQRAVASLLGLGDRSQGPEIDPRGVLQQASLPLQLRSADLRRGLDLDTVLNDNDGAAVNRAVHSARVIEYSHVREGDVVGVGRGVFRHDSRVEVIGTVVGSSLNGRIEDQGIDLVAVHEEIGRRHAGVKGDRVGVEGHLLEDDRVHLVDTKVAGNHAQDLETSQGTFGLFVSNPHGVRGGLGKAEEAELGCQQQ